MNMQLPVLGTLVDWACGIGKTAPSTALGQLDHDKAEAKEQICAVMERLAHKHGLPAQQVNSQTRGFVDEALDVLLCDREDELHAEFEKGEESALR